MKGLPSKRIALKIDICYRIGKYSFQMRACIFQPGNLHTRALKGLNINTKKKSPALSLVTVCLSMANAGREVQYNISAALLSQMASFGENNTNFSWGKCLHRIPKYKQRTDMFMM